MILKSPTGTPLHACSRNAPLPEVSRSPYRYIVESVVYQFRYSSQVLHASKQKDVGVFSCRM